MKVLLCIRHDYLKNFAGDSMQVIKTAQHLNKLGVDVEINNGGITNYSNYDIVHLFNLTRMGETYKYYKDAHRYKSKIVVSPIYWNLKKYYEYTNDIENIRLWNRCKPYRMQILRGARMIYPNSLIEAEVIKNEFGNQLPNTVVYNGVDIESDKTPLYNFKERYNLDNYVLFVARISPRKNQLAVAKICDKLGVKLVLIGNINDRAYFEECMKYKNVTYLGFMDSYNIYNAYRFAKLHVLPSFVETPGLSSLEAAASGCSIVSTSEGSAKEYFKDMAVYCDPFDESDIFNAINKGLKLKKDPRLKTHILENYNWERCVETLYDSYVNILKTE